jgi:glycosyltransferase involved in cell wall biosynthesis
MTLGFHYHTTFILENDTIKVPGQIGVFLEELAKNCEKLYLFLEEARHNDTNDHDYVLHQENIKLIRIGYKSSFYKRLFWPGDKLSIVSAHASELDCLLIRAPSPMLPLLFLKLYKVVPTQILVVGNYLNGISGLKQPLIRKIGIIAVLHIYNLIQLYVIRKAKIFVNSRELYDTYSASAQHTTLIKTTTLTADSFYTRQDTCQNNEIRILYTGRINFQKGLRELIEAVALLTKKFNLKIDVVGWEDPGTFSFKDSLQGQADDLGIGNRIQFLGKKRVGDELNYYYRNSDIFALPTYHEGFPRTIWEAMANSLPIICTPVGGIPHELENRVHALFVAVKDSRSLANAIEELILNGELRRTLIRSAYTKSSQSTVEIQTRVLLNEIKNSNADGKVKSTGNRS